MEEAFLTVDEIAEILKLSGQTIRNWIDAGKLPAVRLGRRVRVRREDFDAFVAAGAGAPATPTGRGVAQFRVVISDRPGPAGEQSTSGWTFEIDANSADRAATSALARWRKKVGRGVVAESILVNRLAPHA